MSTSTALGLLAVAVGLSPSGSSPAAEGPKPAAPVPAAAEAAETRAFMRALLRYVRDHHLKQDRTSPQAGMIYEYVDVRKLGRHGQWVQGEGLDTMHDGAWFMAALAQAYRATGDPEYVKFLGEWPLPFYLKMLNHSDELFSPDRDDSTGKYPFDREHALQKGEKGFVPYYWDDGASVSIEGFQWVNGKLVYPCRDNLAGKPNPDHRLDGYSLGCSNHMAQDLAVMLEAVWPLAESPDRPLAAYREQVKEAARNLYASRLRHFGHIPVVEAALAVTADDPVARRNIPRPGVWAPANEYTRLHDPRPNDRVVLPPFGDNQEYVYWYSLARDRGRFERAAAQALVYDAYTLPLMYRHWSDNAPVLPGINRFDLTVIAGRDGKLERYRSQQLLGGGSRFGPQNMVTCGRALQLLDEYPGLWEERLKSFPDDVRVRFGDPGADDQPTTDPVSLDTVSVRLAADRDGLTLSGSLKGDSATITLWSKPDGTGRKADLVLTRGGAARARGANDAGLSVQILPARGADGPTGFRVRVPFMILNDQKPWWTAYEHGRASVAVGPVVKNLYFLSDEARVRRSLLAELAGGLRTWQRIFQDKGYIPTGLDNVHSVGRHPADVLSDAGGYAHLIAAGAQYLLYLDGRRDWRQEMPR